MCLRKYFKLNNNYIHNCVMALPYPNFTVSELQTTPLSDLAYVLSTAKSSASITHATAAYSRIKQYTNDFRAGTKIGIIAFPQDSDECLFMTNMINGRVFDIDWSGLGGGKTVFRYKSTRNSINIPPFNMVTVVGKQPDGRIALEVVLDKKRMEVLEDEILRLSSEIN